MRGKNKKGKIKYGILTAAAAAVVWLFMPFHTIKGSGEEIYVGGMPDSWPFEFYDSEKASYQGILPEILDTAAGQADMEIRYVNGSKEDNRLSLAGNMQVDAVWTMGLTDGGTGGSRTAQRENGDILSGWGRKDRYLPRIYQEHAE